MKATLALYGHVEIFEGEEVKLGVWVRSRRRAYLAEALSAERIDVLEALPGWEWDPLEVSSEESQCVKAIR